MKANGSAEAKFVPGGSEIGLWMTDRRLAPATYITLRPIAVVTRGMKYNCSSPRGEEKHRSVRAEN